LKEIIAFCGLECHECGAFLATKKRDGNLASDRYYWIMEPKTSQAKRPEAYLWGMHDMRGGVAWAIF
jgi:hypothetical protein